MHACRPACRPPRQAGRRPGRGMAREQRRLAHQVCTARHEPRCAHALAPGHNSPGGSWGQSSSWQCWRSSRLTSIRLAQHVPSEHHLGLWQLAADGRFELTQAFRAGPSSARPCCLRRVLEMALRRHAPRATSARAHFARIGTWGIPEMRGTQGPRGTAGHSRLAQALLPSAARAALRGQHPCPVRELAETVAPLKRLQ